MNFIKTLSIHKTVPLQLGWKLVYNFISIDKSFASPWQLDKWVKIKAETIRRKAAWFFNHPWCHVPRQRGTSMFFYHNGLKHLHISSALATKLHFLQLYIPLNPRPLVTPMMSMFSSWAKTLVTGTAFSIFSRTQSTFFEMEPPFTWISTMWAFFWRFFSRRVWNGRSWLNGEVINYRNIEGRAKGMSRVLEWSQWVFLIRPTKRFACHFSELYAFQSIKK